MRKNTIFTGSGVAIVTPFKDGAVDYDALGKLIEFQIANSTDAIIICGTTGESSTLTDEEHRGCIEYAIKKVAGRVPVIAGTGSNDTAYAVELSKFACDAGADGLLLVTPYYNKASVKGLIAHYKAINDAVDCPCIIYNVPSRTGCNVTIPVYKALVECENMVAIKEASGNISQIAEILSTFGDRYDVYSGNDDQILPILSLGGKGVISVLANPMPRETHDICQLYFDGKTKEATALQLKLIAFCKALFCEVNPIPVKTAMAAMGYCTEELRLPLCEMEEANKEKLFAEMKKLNLI